MHTSLFARLSGFIFAISVSFAEANFLNHLIKPSNPWLSGASISAAAGLGQSYHWSKNTKNTSRILNFIKKHPKSTLFTAAALGAWGTYGLYNWYTTPEKQVNTGKIVYNPRDLKKAEEEVSPTEPKARFDDLKKALEDKNFAQAQVLVDTDKSLINTYGDSFMQSTLLIDECNSDTPRIDVIHWLLDHGALTDCKDRHGYTCFSKAILHKKYDLLLVLVQRSTSEKFGDQDFDPSYGIRPLTWAFQNGQFALILLLLQRGEELKESYTVCKKPLLWALKNKSEDLFDYFFTQAQGDLLEDYDGLSLLHHAAELNDVKALTKLLKVEGFTVNMRCSEQMTPLHFAAKDGGLQAVEFLLKNGANVHAKNKDSGFYAESNKTPLHMIGAEAHCHPKTALPIIKALVKAGADVNAQTSAYITSLHWPSNHGCLDSVKFLVEEAGADITVATQSGTPLQWTLAEGHYDVALYLIEQGTQLDNVARSMTPGKLALEVAKQSGNTKEKIQKFRDLARLIQDINKMQQGKISAEDFMVKETNKEFCRIKYMSLVNQMVRQSDALKKLYQTKELYSDDERDAVMLQKSLAGLKSALEDLYDYYLKNDKQYELLKLITSCNLSIKQIRALVEQEVFFDQSYKHKKKNVSFTPFDLKIAYNKSSNNELCDEHYDQALTSFSVNSVDYFNEEYRDRYKRGEEVNINQLACALQFLNPQVHNVPEKIQVPAFIQDFQKDSLYKNDESDIVQVKVLQQNGSSDCGYHSVKNGIELIKVAQDEKTAQKSLDAMRDSAHYAKLNKEWNDSVNTNNDMSIADYAIMSYEVPVVTYAQYITNLGHLYNGFAGNESLLPDLVEVAKKFTTNDTYSHVFITGLSAGHWIAVLVHKANGKLYYVIADSLNSDETANAMIKQIQSITQGDLSGLYRQFITEKLAAAQQEIQDSNNGPQAYKTLRDALGLKHGGSIDDTLLKDFVGQFEETYKKLQVIATNNKKFATDYKDALIQVDAIIQRLKNL